MGILDAIVLVPAHLMGDQRCQRHSLLPCLCALIQVEQPRGVPSQLCGVERKATDLPLEDLLPAVVTLLGLVGQVRVVFVLAGGGWSLAGRVEDGGLHVLFLPQAVVVLLKCCFLIDLAGIQWTGGDGLRGGGNCGLVAFVVKFGTFAEGGMGVDEGGVVDTGGVAQISSTEDVTVLPLVHLKSNVRIQRQYGDNSIYGRKREGKGEGHEEVLIIMHRHDRIDVSNDMIDCKGRVSLCSLFSMCVFEQFPGDIPHFLENGIGPGQSPDHLRGLLLLPPASEHLRQVLYLPIVVVEDDLLKMCQKNEIIASKITLAENLLQKFTIHRLLFRNAAVLGGEYFRYLLRHLEKEAFYFLTGECPAGRWWLLAGSYRMNLKALRMQYFISYYFVFRSRENFYSRTCTTERRQIQGYVPRTVAWSQSGDPDGDSTSSVINDLHASMGTAGRPCRCSPLLPTHPPPPRCRPQRVAVDLLTLGRLPPPPLVISAGMAQSALPPRHVPALLSDSSDGPFLVVRVERGPPVRGRRGGRGAFRASAHCARSGISPPRRRTCPPRGAAVPRSDATTRRSPAAAPGRLLKDPSIYKQPQQNLLRTQKINPNGEEKKKKEQGE